MAIQLIEVLSEQDEHFLFEVYRSIRAQEVVLWGWSEQEQLHFLHTQYTYQTRSYHHQYPQLDRNIIEFEGQKVGRLLLSKSENEWIVVDISILPEYRNQGIGNALLQDIQKQAQVHGLPIRLSVDHGNPAKRLYERLGFAQVNADELRTGMQWQPE